MLTNKFFSREELPKFLNMQNEAGEYVDLYIPRKCSASNRILAAKDHASIQINVADVDESTGRMTGGFKPLFPKYMKEPNIHKYSLL